MIARKHRELNSRILLRPRLEELKLHYPTTLDNQPTRELGGFEKQDGEIVDIEVDEVFSFCAWEASD